MDLPQLAIARQCQHDVLCILDMLAGFDSN